VDALDTFDSGDEGGSFFADGLDMFEDGDAGFDEGEATEAFEGLYLTDDA
jgi:hypothetical protein